jgi:hypothetical protein
VRALKASAIMTNQSVDRHFTERGLSELLADSKPSPVAVFFSERFARPDGSG